MNDDDDDDGKSDYMKYRGKCKQMAEAAIAADPTLTLVRGFYHCPMWGEQQHWWAVKPDGTIVDPTARQFPSKGAGTYVVFSGICTCKYCGKEVLEEEATFAGHHVYCCGECYGHDVGF
jgi:hypothetical protein